jgi:uncharacterized protein YndB with AHSA1/START domain
MIDVVAASMKPEFHYTLYIGKPAQEVWKGLVTKAAVDRYYMAPLHTLELKEGGKISYGTKSELITGTILEADAPKKLVHSFNFAGSNDPETRVTYEIEEVGKRMCSLTISHTGFTGENQTFANISGGWPAIASSLKSLLETGKPLPWSDEDEGEP